MSHNEKQNHQSNHAPHRLLGRQLKTMRQRFQESLGETSGAVEIEVEQLDRFERGSERPSEDILMLLISHFNVTDDEAVRLWEMAGYDEQSFPFGEVEERPAGSQPQGGPAAGQPHAIILAIDQRVLYTNGVEIVGDDNGIIMNFTQLDAGNSQSVPVSRVGMSYAQAEKLMQALQHALMHKKYSSGPKQLPPSDDEDKKS